MKTRKTLITLAAACLAVGLSACSLLGGTDADRDSEGQITAPGDVGAFNLNVGDCVVLADIVESSDTISSVPATPCSEAHDAEVTDKFDVTGLDDYDDAAISEQADAGCEAALIEYVGPNWLDLELDFTYLYPTQESWSTDKEILCFAIAGDLTLTASVKGTGN